MRTGLCWFVVFCLAVWAAPVDRAAAGAVAGGCVWTSMTATYSNGGLLSTAVAVDLTAAGGVCATTSGAGSGSLHVVLSPSPVGMTCTGGAATGSGAFSSAPQLPTTPVVATAVSVGGVWVVTVTNGVSPIGTGAFTQSPSAVAACLSGGTATWSGLLAFVGV